MTFRRALAALGVLALTALGLVTTTHHAEPEQIARSAPTTTQPAGPTVDPFPNEVYVAPTTTTVTEPPQATVARSAPVSPPSPPRTSWPASYQPCDGEYPPCWRVETESHGDYNIVNWGGCGGRNCYGKWQFSGEWACKLGLPCDLTLATPTEQDEAAKLLWNHGQGCGNWSACS